MTKPVRWLDAHAHLDSDELFPQRVDVLDRALKAGVERVLLVNSDSTESSFIRTLECANLPHPVQRNVCFGIHPHHATNYDTAMEEKLKQLLEENSVIGLGEIGLDFYYNFSPREIQIETLRKQLQLARSKALPVIIHCRDAYPTLAKILGEISNAWNGMIHCFTGNIEEMAPLLELGFMISFSGIVTFKKATDLHASARSVPIDRILVETDAPYLAPVPFRGKVNEPGYVVHTAKFVAALKNISDLELSQAVTRNFDSLFGKRKSG
jgi:TatD DNase family protein